LISERAYKWWVVAMLWSVCLFNYADRQAIFSVFPVLKSELRLSDFQLGIIGSSFMWVYALIGPIAGWLGDRLSRKMLICGGLIFWSAAIGATAFCREYWQLVFCRSLGGFGEAFYFPSAMSLVSDYHSGATRSRAMSIHQSSVYMGTIAGGAAAGYIAEFYGWRRGFLLLGVSGILVGLALISFLREPNRGQSEEVSSEVHQPVAPLSGSLFQAVNGVLANRLAAILILVFIGANFVAVVFLTWAPSFLFWKFRMSLALAGLNGTAYLQIASVLGVLSGGLLADRLARRTPSGRTIAQVFGLVGGIPFLFLIGRTSSVRYVLTAMAGFGYFKGVYDANIFASLYDVVRVKQRAVAAGLLNSLGWLGGGVAPIAVAVGSQRFGMGICISATSCVYLVIACLLTWAAAVRLKRQQYK
jgi:MFS family permease